MISAIRSCTLQGIDPHLVICETSLAAQLPTFTLVGLPSSFTQESRERIRAAITNSGFDWPARKITINLLPSNLPKWGGQLELAMALGIITAQSDLLEHTKKFNILALGELSLSGLIRPCGWLSLLKNWVLAQAHHSVHSEKKPLLVLAHTKDLFDLKQSINGDLGSILTFKESDDLKTAVQNVFEFQPSAERINNVSQIACVKEPSFKTLSQICGEPLAVAAAVVAVAGKHHCLFAGPQGMGKSMLVRAICEASSPLTEEEASNRRSILGSFSGHFIPNIDFQFPRPTVYLQTSTTRAALEGSALRSGQVIPGELTCAHFGILVADEFLEFHRDVTEALRQPLEEGIVRLQRAECRMVLPAKFQFLATTNLCPCGYFGHADRRCRCLKTKRANYHSKLSGPILDRFDIVVRLGARSEQKRLATQKYFLPIRSVNIPTDLEHIIEKLNAPEFWPVAISRAQNRSQANVTSSIMKRFWESVPFTLSERGRFKIVSIANTVRLILDEELNETHLRFALLLRQDLDMMLRGEIDKNLISPSCEKIAEPPPVLM